METEQQRIAQHHEENQARFGVAPATDQRGAHDQAVGALEDQIHVREVHVTDGVETPRLASLILEKYVDGLIEGLNAAGANATAGEVYRIGRAAMLRINPNHDEDGTARRMARPSDLKLGLENREEGVRQL